MAVYYGYHTLTTPDGGVRTIPEHTSPSCNCTKALRFTDAGIDIMTKLTEIDIPIKSRTEIINMLDNLDWVEVKSCNSKLNFNFADDIFNNKAELAWVLLINSISFMIMHALAQDTYFGVIIKIIFRHTSNFIRQLFHPQLFSQLIRESKMKLSIIASKAAGGQSYDDDDTFTQCSSINLPRIETEEVLPKEQDLEERLESADAEDIGMMDIVDPSPTVSCIDTVLTSTEVHGVEKLEKYLHQNYDRASKEDINLTDMDEDTFVEQLGKLRASRSTI